MAVIGARSDCGGVLFVRQGDDCGTGQGKKGLFRAFDGVGAMPNIGQGARRCALRVVWGRVCQGGRVYPPLFVRARRGGRCNPSLPRAKIFLGTFAARGQWRWGKRDFVVGT